MKKVFLNYLGGLIYSAFASLIVYISYVDIPFFAHPDSIWRATAFSVLVYLAIAAILYLLIREHASAGLVATFLVLGLMYIWRVFLVVIVVTLTTWIALAIVGKKFRLKQLQVSITAIGLMLAGYFGFRYLRFVLDLPDNNPALPLELQTSLPPSSKPDIYYIILDSYGSEAMLAELHDIDNSAFISALEHRGFIVPDSKANYPRTVLSLGSSLNMQYLDAVATKMGDSDLWWPLMGLLTHSQVRQFLESQGYLTVNIASGSDFTTIPDADIFKKPYPFLSNEFERAYFQSTNLSVFGFLNKIGISIPSYEAHRKTVLYEFEQLKSFPNLPSPKFVYVHIIPPHPPFIFDEEGNFLRPEYPFTLEDDRYFISPPSKYRDGYQAQLAYVNQQILAIVDSLLENSSTPPVIILQGDHGPGIYVDYLSSDNTCLFERFSILNAYYLPGVPREKVPADISPVNTFRMVLNEYFSTGLEYLPNKSYFSSYFEFYEFEDVTSRLNGPCQTSGNKGQ